MLMDAYELRNFDSRYKLHQLAYLNQVAKSTKVIGKREVSLFPTFNEFFDYDKELRKIEGGEEEIPVDNMKKAMLNINAEINREGVN